MKRAVLIYVWIIAALLQISCSKAYLPEINGAMVVEGWIEEGRSPIVMVTLAVPTAVETISSSELGEYVCRRAIVTVTDGCDTVTLTGKVDKDYVTQFVYTTSRIRGESGKTYTLNVQYSHYTATATTFVPASVKLDSVTVSSKDTLFSLTGHFKDNKDTKDYYKFFTLVEGQETSFSSSFLSAIDDASLEGEAHIEVLCGRTFNTNEWSHPYFHAGDIVRVKLCTMDEASYRYWKDYDALSTLSNNPLFPMTMNPTSNMVGAYGYWAGYGTDGIRVEIPASVD